MTLVEAHDRAEARVAELMGTINTATAELVRLIAEVDAAETWGVAGGITSMQHWVTWQCGVSSARANAWVASARRLAELPEVAAVFDEGQLSEESMALVARHVPSMRDSEVAPLARQMLHSQLARLVRTMPKPEPDAEPAASVDEPPATVVFSVD